MTNEKLIARLIEKGLSDEQIVARVLRADIGSIDDDNYEVEKKEVEQKEVEKKEVELPKGIKELRDGLTVEEIEENYSWLLKADISDAIIGKSINDYIIWYSGTWKDGIWKGGYWKDGTWEGGYWEDGTWLGGTWKGGTWKNGTWNGGIWEDGTWYDGTWYDGTWLDGTWKTGWWNGGTDIDDKEHDDSPNNWK